ncbi:response regulator [Geomonas sp. Red875]|uniref:Response regulator n=2 Tax=Geomesophilobacter sediminis TaxID=2798584 RepID=A0A8J7J1B5_9BACT|nr:response regulator [Geomesophilobacter sediminis]
MKPQSLSVLVMDDERVCREIAGAMLQLLGHQVKTCKNAEEVCFCYKQAKDAGSPYDLVIMDLVLYGTVGGIEAAREILEFDPKAKLVISSGYSNQSVLTDPQGYGFVSSMPKPYTIEQLEDTLVPFGHRRLRPHHANHSHLLS